MMMMSNNKVKKEQNSKKTEVTISIIFIKLNLFI
jgi:hypothetical protein